VDDTLKDKALFSLRRPWGACDTLEGVLPRFLHRNTFSPHHVLYDTPTSSDCL